MDESARNFYADLKAEVDLEIDGLVRNLRELADEIEPEFSALLDYPFPETVEIRPDRIGPAVVVKWFHRTIEIAPDSRDSSGYVERIVAHEVQRSGRTSRIGELDYDESAQELTWLPDDLSTQHLLHLLGGLYAAVNRLLSRVDDTWVSDLNEATAESWRRHQS